MKLAAVDRALLGGDMGPAAARAMRLLQRYGEGLGADRFIDIRSAHIDGCLFHGLSSLDFARAFVDLGGRVRVPTTLNVAAVDLVHPEWYPGRAALIADQAELVALHETLGCAPTLTCAPYQRPLRPALGEHVAWAESNAIVFANSVLGARTDRYGDFTDLCAALTGRVPLAGLHCDAARTATIRVDVVDVAAGGIDRDLYFAALGYALGLRVGGAVAVLTGIAAASEDELKALGTAAAASGAVAMFHVAGITPEAPRDTAGLPMLAIDADALGATVAALCPLAMGEPVAALCLGTPHYSDTEFAALAEAVAGRRAAPGVEVLVSTSRAIAANWAGDDALRGFGVRLIVDTCSYVTPVVRAGNGAIVTTSAKFAHYAPGNIRRRTGLMGLARCLRVAEAGRVLA